MPPLAGGTAAADARTGILRDVGVILQGQGTLQLARELAGFVRECRQGANRTSPRVYLAIGAFEDLSLNNRRPDFPTQLRAYLLSAYRKATVTLLEREYVDAVLQEVRMDFAGLTEESGVTPPSRCSRLLVGDWFLPILCE